MDVDAETMGGHVTTDTNATIGHVKLMDKGEFIYPTMIIYGLFSVFGLTANLLVIITIAKSHRLWSVTSVFICHLAVGDLITLIFCMPFTVSSAYLYKNWAFGETMCYVVRTAGALGPTLSVLALVVMAYERYIGIVHPLHAKKLWSNSRVVMATIVVYILAFTRAIIRPATGNIYTSVNGTHTCSEMPGSVFAKAYHTSGFILFYPVALGAVAYFYLRITAELQQDSNMKNSSKTAEDGKRRVVAMIYIILVVFSVSWLPIHTVALMFAYKVQLTSAWIPAYVFIARILEYGNCVFNPFLYSLLSGKFKRALVETWSPCCPCITLCVPEKLGSLSESETSKYRSSAYKKSIKLRG